MSIKLIVVPGLGDGVSLATFLASRLGYDFEIFSMGWRDDEAFEPKIARLLAVIDKNLRRYDKVVGLGISAGGSAILNAFERRQDEMCAAINVCGRLHAGEGVSPSLESAARRSLAFKQSVLMFEKEKNRLSLEARRKVLTIRPLWDEMVPTSTVGLEGAVNAQIASVEHMASIVMAMTIYKHHITSFLRDLPGLERVGSES